MKARITLAVTLAALMLGTLLSAVVFAGDGNDQGENQRPLPCYSDV